MNTLSKLAIGVGVVAVAGYGVHAYLKSEIEAGFEAQIKKFNTENEGTLSLSYKEIDASPFSGSVGIEQFKIDVANIGGAALFADATISGSINANGDFEVTEFNTSDFKLESAAANVSFSNFSVSGPNLSVLGDEDALKSLDSIPVTSFNLEGLKGSVLNPTTGQQIEFSVDKYDYAIDADTQELNRFEMTGITFNGALENGLPLNMDLGTIKLKGGDLSWYQDLVALQADAPSLEDPESDAAKEALTNYTNKLSQAMAPVAANYMGVDSFEWSGFSVSLPNSSTISFDRIYIEDIDRVDNFVVGAKTGWTNIALPNLKGFDPSFDAQLDLLGLSGTTINLVTEARYDAEQKSQESTTSLSVDNIMDIEADYTLNNFDPKTYYDATLAAYSPDFTANPEAVLGLYAELLKDVELSLSLTDKSIVNRLVQGYAEQAGASEEALRDQFTGLAIANISALFGAYAPDNLAQAIAAYMAETSKPIKFNVKTTDALTTEAFANIDAANWGQYFRVTVE
jgi:hypothetical protein